jgi:hypothetical protein
MAVRSCAGCIIIYWNQQSQQMTDLAVGKGEKANILMHVNTRRTERFPSRMFAFFFHFPFLFHPSKDVDLQMQVPMQLSERGLARLWWCGLVQTGVTVGSGEGLALPRPLRSDDDPLINFG